MRRPHAPPPAAKINVTPLIDVVMVLIVFYLIVGNLAQERLPPVALPRAASGSTDETSPDLVISVTDSPSGTAVVVDGVTMAPEDVASLLSARLSDPASASVHIRAARSLPYASVKPVIDACRRAGLRSLRLVAERGSP